MSMVLIVITFMITGANSDFRYQNPKGNIKIIAKSSNPYYSKLLDVSKIHENQINRSSITEWYNGKLLEETIWIDEISLHDLSKEQWALIKNKSHNKVNIIVMGDDLKIIANKFNIRNFSVVESDGDTVIVGYGVKLNGARADVTIIQVPKDRIDTEGDKPIVNAFIGASNQMLIDN